MSPRACRVPFNRFLLPVIACVTIGLAGPPARAAKEPDVTAWPEITAAEKALTSVPEDPEADAVVLRKSRDGRILRQADDYVNLMKYHWRLKVLTERGKEYGEVRIRADKGSRVDALEARTIKPDGTIVAVPPDQVFEKTVLQAGSYRLTEKVFNFPAVEPGAILEYRYVRHDGRIFFPEPYFFAGQEYTLVSRVSQGFLGGMSYTMLCDLCPPGAQPVIGEWRELKQQGQLYTMELKGVPGYRDEALMPPERETTARLDMVLATWKGRYASELGRVDRFFVDWASVSQYVWFWYGKAIKDGQGALKPVVESWIAGVTDPQERLKAVMRHVREDFRYLPFESIAGFSRSIDDMLKQKIADNEDKAVLLLAALKTMGVEGQPVLVAGRDVGSVNPKFYSLGQFSHVIVGLPKPDGGRDYLDPTVSYAPYAFVPWRDSGAGALIISGATGELVDLPVKAEINATRFRVNLSPKAGGKSDVDLQAEFVGEDAVDLREELVPASEAARETWVKSWLGDRIQGAAPGTFSFENLTDVEKPIVMKTTFQAPGLVTVADEIFVVHGCVLSCLGGNPLSRATRQHPFYIDRGWNREETVSIRPPSAGMVATQMPPMATARSSAATMSLSCSAQGDESVRCVRQFSARRNRWPASEHAALRAMYDKIIQADRTTVAFAAGAAGQ